MSVVSLTKHRLVGGIDGLLAVFSWVTWLLGCQVAWLLVFLVIVEFGFDAVAISSSLSVSSVYHLALLPRVALVTDRVTCCVQLTSLNGALFFVVRHCCCRLWNVTLCTLHANFRHIRLRASPPHLSGALGTWLELSQSLCTKSARFCRFLEPNTALSPKTCLSR